MTFTGVYVGPLVDQSPSGGTHYDVPDLAFDADQYLREVERAADDRSWETDARKTARLLREQLMRNDEHFIDRGYSSPRMNVRSTVAPWLLWFVRA